MRVYPAAHFHYSIDRKCPPPPSRPPQDDIKMHLGGLDFSPRSPWNAELLDAQLSNGVYFLITSVETFVEKLKNHLVDHI